MALTYTPPVLAIAILALFGTTLATPVNYQWPDPSIDFLETMLYQQAGYRFNTFASALGPDRCTSPFSGNGRNVAAE